MGQLRALTQAFGEQLKRPNSRQTNKLASQISSLIYNLSKQAPQSERLRKIREAWNSLVTLNLGSSHTNDRYRDFQKAVNPIEDAFFCNPELSRCALEFLQAEEGRSLAACSKSLYRDGNEYLQILWESKQKEWKADHPFLSSCIDYLGLDDPNLSANQKFERLFNELRGQVPQDWNSPLDRFDPVLYEDMAKAIQPLQDQALQIVWRDALFQAFPISPNRPPSNATAAEIRTWLNDPANQNALDSVKELSFIYKLSDRQVWGLTQRIAVIPTEVRKFRNIKHLGVSDHPIRSVPSWIGELRALRYLDLSYNHLHSLSSSIRRLTSLNNLSLDGNRFSNIPAFLRNLTQLKRLSMASNQISVIPSFIGQFHDLRALYLHDNVIRLVPPEIGNISQLIELGLYRNKIEILPSELANLRKLMFLRLFQNPLSIYNSSILFNSASISESFSHILDVNSHILH